MEMSILFHFKSDPHLTPHLPVTNLFIMYKLYNILRKIEKSL